MEEKLKLTIELKMIELKDYRLMLSPYYLNETKQLIVKVIDIQLDALQIELNKINNAGK